MPNPRESTDYPKLYKDSRYSHIEHFSKAIGWDLDFRQIDTGPLQSRVTDFGTAQFRILRVEFDRSFHQLGHPPEGLLSFGLPDPSSGTLRWRGRETPSSVLVNFNSKQQLDAVNPPGEFGGYVLYFDPDFLNTFDRYSNSQDDFLKSIAEKGFWTSNDGILEQLNDHLRALTTIARTEGESGLIKWQEVLRNDVPNLIAKIVSEKGYEPELKVSPLRSTALQRATEILSNYEHMPENVDLLCQLSCCSWDTLKRAFKEEYGLGPKAYMKARRLSGVQSELITLGKDAVIADVANKWGFWHMGSFAADYRKQFGELPSDTLKRLPC